MNKDQLLGLPGAYEHVISQPLPVANPTPAYSCNNCKAGLHNKCTPRVYDISWQFDCTCYEKTPHFEMVTAITVPVRSLES